MGWFSGPDVSERTRGGRVEWYGKCEECRKEHYDTDKKRAIRKLEDCARVDKTAKEKARARKEEEARDRAKAKERKKEEEIREQQERNKKRIAQTARELRRLAKNKKCPFCGKSPCKGTKAKCAAVIAAGWESGGDVSDPATFDAQLRWYKNNME